MWKIGKSWKKIKGEEKKVHRLINTSIISTLDKSKQNRNDNQEHYGRVLGGRREEDSGWGTQVYLWWIHFNIWQNQYNIVKFKNKIKLKKKKLKNKEEKGTLKKKKKDMLSQ